MFNHKKSHCIICGKRRSLYGFALSTKDGYWVCNQCLKKAKILHWYTFNTLKTVNSYTAIDILHRIPENMPTNINNQYIHTDIDNMDGHSFEYFCADILRHEGFSNVTVTPGSGDQGVDILAKKEGITYAIQCKHYSSPVGNTPIQEVFAGKAFYGCQVGIVMTNSTFTTGAVQLAQTTGIILWDRSVIDNMILTQNRSINVH